MFQHVKVTCEPLASFFSSVARSLRTIDHKVVREVIQSGIGSGKIRLAMQDGVWHAANMEAPVKGATVSRLARTPVEAWHLVPSLDDKPSGFVEAVDYLSSIQFRMNGQIMDLYLETHRDKDIMSSLLAKEFHNFGAGPYYLPGFWDHRGRLYAKGGVANYQGSQLHRAICDFADSFECNEDDLLLLVDKIQREWKIGESDIRSAIKDPSGFVTHAKVKKPWLCLRYCLAVHEIERTGKTSLILQLDQTASGPGIMAYITGDVRLARYTNMLMSRDGTQQDVYKAASDRVLHGNLLGDIAYLGDGVFLTRTCSKAISVPTYYGANAASSARGLILDDPQDNPVVYLDEDGILIEGVLEDLSEDKFNPTFLPVWKELGWKQSVLVASHVSESYHEAIFGSDRISGVSTRMRTFMIAAKRAARWAQDRGIPLMWETPDGFLANNAKVGEDRSAKTVEENFYVLVDGVKKRIKVSVMPLCWEGTVAGFPPNGVHSGDGFINRKVLLSAKSVGIPVAPVHDSWGFPVPYAHMAIGFAQNAFLDLPPDWFNNILIQYGQDPIFVDGGLDRSEFLKAKYFLS